MRLGEQTQLFLISPLILLFKKINYLDDTLCISNYTNKIFEKKQWKKYDTR
jgi:hypothetical protein